jgi:hypothetical protein
MRCSVRHCRIFYLIGDRQQGGDPLQTHIALLCRQLRGGGLNDGKLLS